MGIFSKDSEPPRQMRTDSERPQALTPVPEQYAGTNLPYRGTQTHGVDVPKDAKYDTREFAHKESEPESYLPEEVSQEPVPVRIVQETARERLDWRATRFLVTNQGQQIVNRHEKRRAMRIRNLSEDTDVMIGNDSGVQYYTGYVIPAGTEIYPFLSTEDVWAVCESGSADICIMYEFAVEL